MKWKMACTKKSGQMTSKATKKIIDRIVNSLEEHVSQGSFVTHGHQDVLTAAIGRPEHSGCVCAVGAGVTIKQYFGLASRISRTSTSMAPKDLEQLTQKIKDQLEKSITQKGLALPLELVVDPSTTHVSTKESCVDPSRQDPNTADSEKCRLYVDKNHPRPVAHGRGKQGAKGPAKPADRPDPDVDPLYLMTLTIPHLFLKPLQAIGCYRNSHRDVYLGAYLNGALKGFNDSQGSKSKVVARWIVVKVNLG
ncbi:hypothetical protein GmHk_07G020432 [Glycine max]|nr:hypothetical protein GmHk_07G020432 [Glycine max]